MKNIFQSLRNMKCSDACKQWCAETGKRTVSIVAALVIVTGGAVAVNAAFQEPSESPAEYTQGLKIKFARAISADNILLKDFIAGTDNFCSTKFDGYHTCTQTEFKEAGENGTLPDVSRYTQQSGLIIEDFHNFSTSCSYYGQNRVLSTYTNSGSSIANRWGPYYVPNSSYITIDHNNSCATSTLNIPSVRIACCK